jgi:uncharacterized Fe-S cluster-containing radical SAM superfamily enzyme
MLNDPRRTSAVGIGRRTDRRKDFGGKRRDAINTPFDGTRNIVKGLVVTGGWLRTEILVRTRTCRSEFCSPSLC